MKNNRLLLSAIFTILWFFSLGQTLNPPRNLTYNIEDENDVYLFWNPPAGDSVYLHWDNGVNASTFGVNAETYSVAARWDTAKLASINNWKIEKVRFYLVNAPEKL